MRTEMASGHLRQPLAIHPNSKLPLQAASYSAAFNIYRPSIRLGSGVCEGADSQTMGLEPTSIDEGTIKIHNMYAQECADLEVQPRETEKF